MTTAEGLGSGVPLGVGCDVGDAVMDGDGDGLASGVGESVDGDGDGRGDEESEGVGDGRGVAVLGLDGLGSVVLARAVRLLEAECEADQPARNT